MKSGDEGDRVTLPQETARCVKELPVGVIDEHDNAWADRGPLNEHFLLLLQVVASEIVNQLFNGPLALGLDVDPFFTLKKGLKASATNIRIN